MTRISSKITYNLLTGGLNNVDSIENINQTPKRTETPDIMNIEYFQLGGIKTMEGNTRFGNQQESAVVGGWEYIKDGKRYMVIATEDGRVNIYNPVTETFDLIYTFPHSSDRVSFCNMNNGVVITNGIDDLVFYEYGRKQAISGTVTIDNDDTSKIIGNETQFKSQLNVGDEVYFEGYDDIYKVKEITDDTNLKVEPALPPSVEINRYYGWYKENSYNNNYLKNVNNNAIDSNGILSNYNIPYEEGSPATIVINNGANLPLNSLRKISYGNYIYEFPADKTLVLKALSQNRDGKYVFPLMEFNIVNSTGVSIYNGTNVTAINIDKPYIKIHDVIITSAGSYLSIHITYVTSDDGITFDQTLKTFVDINTQLQPNDTNIKKILSYYISCDIKIYSSRLDWSFDLKECKFGDNIIGNSYPAKQIYSKQDNPNNITNLYTITGEEGSYVAALYSYSDFNIKDIDEFTIKHDGLEEVYKRYPDIDKDVEDHPERTNLSIYYGPISQCNATLINDDDEDFNRPIRGRAINFYNGRLWVGGKDGLFYSQVGQYNKWDIKYDAGVIGEVYNDTSEVRALGLYSEYLMVHKEYYTYILTCTGDSTTIAIKPYSNVTCNSQQSFIVSNTKYFVYSLDHMDIYPLMQHTVFSDKFLGEPITQKVRNIFLKLRTADLDKIFFVSHPKKRWMIAYLPLVDQLGSGYGLVYDFQTKSFLVRKVPQEVTIAFNFDGNIYLGTRDGLVLKEFDSLYFDNDIINAYYRSPWFDWADGYTHSFSEFAIEIANDHNQDFYIRTFKDGSSPYEDRIITSDLLTGDSLVWDGLEGQDLPDNDTYWDYDSWVEGTFNHIRMLLPNNVFDKFQLEIGTNQLGQAFAIYGYGFRRIETDEAPW